VRRAGTRARHKVAKSDLSKQDGGPSLSDRLGPSSVLIHRSAWKGILRTSHKRNSRKFAVASSAGPVGAYGPGRGKAYSGPVLAPRLATHVARIRYERLRLATAEVPENFLRTRGGNAYIRNSTSGLGMSTYPTTQPPLGTTLPPPDRLGAVFTLVRGMGILRSSYCRSSRKLA
jgi:hypothetical protein